MQCQDLPSKWERLFPTQFLSQRPINIIKMLWWRFQQCLGMFGILLVEASPETGLFWHLSDYIFGVRNFENTKGMRVIFCWKHSKFQLHFKKAAKNWEKCFCFWDNRIWINIIILSLLTRGYLWSGANVLKRSPKIWHVNKRDFFQVNYLDNDQ